MSTVQALERAVEIVGGQSKLARKLHELTGRKIGQGHIWSWLNRTKSLPAEWAIPVEIATQGQITRHDVRPDIYPRQDAA